MKTIAFALVALLATTNALPQQVQTSDLKDSRFIDQIVIGLIDSVIKLIEENGLDPYIVEGAQGEYSLDGIFSASAYVENFVFTGLSNIVVNDVSFSSGALNFDLSLPRLAASVGDAAADVTIGSQNIQGQLSGSLTIIDLRLAGRVTLGLSGYLLEDFSLSCRLGGIEADLNTVTIQGRDITDGVNNFLGNTLPSLLTQYEEEINRFFERVIIRIVKGLF